MDGFITISKKILNWDGYKDHDKFRVFMHLLLKANYKKGWFDGVELERGQVLIGRKKLAIEIGLSEQTIRTQLTNLVKTKEITIKSTNKNSIVTICKYDSYQQKNKIINQQTNQQNEEESTSKLTTTNNYLKNINTIVKIEDEKTKKFSVENFDTRSVDPYERLKAKKELVGLNGNKHS